MFPPPPPPQLKMLPPPLRNITLRNTPFFEAKLFLKRCTCSTQEMLCSCLSTLLQMQNRNTHHLNVLLQIEFTTSIGTSSFVSSHQCICTPPGHQRLVQEVPYRTIARKVWRVAAWSLIPITAFSIPKCIICLGRVYKVPFVDLTHSSNKGRRLCTC